MVGEYLPELKKYMSRTLKIKLNGNRLITGKLAGYDGFMNLTIEEAVEVISPTESIDIGVMVST